MAPYDVIPAPAVKRQILGMRSQKDRDDLADSLRQELDQGPNASKEYRFRYGDVEYTATPLSFKGYVAVHRRTTAKELKSLGRQPSRKGFYVLDLLPPEAGFSYYLPSFSS